MAGSTVNLPAHVLATGPGVAMIGPNVRVRGLLGYLGTRLDTLTFSGASGLWTSSNTRTRVQGVYLVSQSSVGTATTASGPVTVIVAGGDPRIRSR